MSWRDHERTRGSKQSDGVSTETHVESLEVVREESRHVLTEQLELLSDIDDKAMRSVRTALILVGLVVSAVQISGGPDSVSNLGRAAFTAGATGVILLLCSILTGIYTYAVSDPPLGIGETHRRDVLDGGYSHHEWLRLQVSEYDEWTETAAEMNDRNVRTLHATLWFLVGGIVSLLAATVVSAAVPLSRVVSPVFVSALVDVAVAVVLILIRQ